MSLLVDDETVSFSLEINVGKAVDEARRLQTVLSRSLALVRRATGGNEDLRNYIDFAQKSIVWTNRLRLALRALQLLRMSMGDPLAWAFAGLAIAEVGADVMVGMQGS